MERRRNLKERCLEDSAFLFPRSGSGHREEGNLACVTVDFRVVTQRFFTEALLDESTSQPI